MPQEGKEISMTNFVLAMIGLTIVSIAATAGALWPVFVTPNRQSVAIEDDRMPWEEVDDSIGDCIRNFVAVDQPDGTVMFVCREAQPVISRPFPH